MRTTVTFTVTLTLLSLLILTGCKNIQDVGAVVVIPPETSSGTPSTKNVPPPHAPAHGRRAKNNPPHAPAHGYRHRQPEGVELVFDSGLGVYVVVDMTDIFFNNGIYLRFQDGYWQMNVRLGNEWRDASDYEVPTKLKKAKSSKHKGRGRGREKDNGNKDW